jgi:capsular exopolysaccharide synthesis family protein
VEQLFLNLIRRWFWLLGLVALVAGVATFAVIAQQPLVYEGKARLIVGPGVDSPSPDVNTLRAAAQLLQTYTELATTRPVLQAVIDDLNLNLTPEMLQEQITVTSNQETQILTIRVQDTHDPARAAAIANAMADLLVRLSPSGTEGPQLQLNNQMRSQADMIEQSIASTGVRITQLEADLQAATSTGTESPGGGQSAQGVGDQATEARITQLEADLQAALNLDQQGAINTNILQESDAGIQAKIKQLETDLKAATGINAERLILNQIASERDDLLTLHRADLERQRRILQQLLEDSIASTQSRIAQLEDELQVGVNVEMRRLLSDQVVQERNHLAELRRIDLQGQRETLEQLFQDGTAGTQATLTQLEADFEATADANTRRGVIDEITQERQRLFSAELLNLNKQQQVIDQVLHLTISSTQATITRLQADLPVVATELEARQIADQIMQERARLSDDQRTLASLYASLKESLTNQVRIVEPAIVGIPADTQLKLKVLVGAIAGLVLALVIALAFEFFDDTVKSIEDVSQAAGVPVLGTIAKRKALAGDNGPTPAVWAMPDSRIAESYRTLSTKLALSKTHHSLSSMLVISAEADHDSGEIAANLAITWAQTGKRVVLVDANLRRPTIGHLFGVPDLGGLADVLTDVRRPLELVSVGETTLSILPSGEVSSNPFEQLASPHMASLIAQLTEQADIVIIVAPSPTLFSETMLLASLVDGVILAVRSGGTRRQVVRDVIEDLRLVSARIIGVVFDTNYRRGVRLPFLQRAAVSPGTEGSLEDRKPGFISLRKWGKRRLRTDVHSTQSTRPGLGD